MPNVLAGEVPAEGWPFSFALTNDVVGFGSSTMSAAATGGPDGPMKWLQTDTTGGAHNFSSMSGAVSVGNYGSGGKTSTQILAIVQAADSRAKAAWTIFSLSGNYESGAVHAEDLIIANAQTMVGATGINHNNYMHCPKHNDGSGGNGGWDAHVIASVIRGLKAVCPAGSVDDASLIFNTYPVTDPADIAAQLIDRVPPSLQVDTAHLNGNDTALGYVSGNHVLSRYSYQRWVDAMCGGLPFIPHQRLWSNEITNQTSGGLVCNVEHYSSIAGTLTGAVVDIPSGYGDWSASIETGVIKIRRATSARLLAGKYDLPIRVTKAGKSRITTVRVWLGDSSPSGDYRATINGDVMGKNGSIAGASSGAKTISLAIGLKQRAGADGTTRQIIKTGLGGAAGALDVEIKTTNRLAVVVRNASHISQVSLDSSGAAGQLLTEANGVKWVFVSVDTAADYGRIAVDANAATTGTIITDGVLVPSPAGVEGTLTNLLFADGGNIQPANMELAAIWVSSGYVDFTATTGNRDLVRDPATGKSVLGSTGGVVSGVSPFLWIEGAGNISAGINLANPEELWDTLNKSGIGDVTA
ncbi:MAG: hypothetical protein Q8Q77_13145 [Phenylobacterium sp.]|nr:hypothetical protein [Phenylobacterium sp.]